MFYPCPRAQMRVCLHNPINALRYLCVFRYGYVQGEPCRAGCEHEKAAGGGLEDETEVLAGYGEKLPWTGGGAREEGRCSMSQLDQ